MNVNVPVEELSRLVEQTRHDMPADLARIVTHLHFTDDERRRSEHLAARCDAGELTDAERVEYEDLVRAATLLGLLKARAASCGKRCERREVGAVA